MTDLQSTDLLFPSAEKSPVVESARHAGPVAVVAIERSVDRVLDYAITPRFAALIAVGQRVRVPLGRGNKSTYGYVVDLKDQSDHPKLKALIDIDDDRVLVQPKMMELARWIGRYYISPLGMVLESIIPSAVKKRIGMGFTRMVRLAKSPEEVQAILEATKSKKRKTLLSRLLQLKPDEAIALHTLAFEAEVSIPTAAKLRRESLITITEEPDLESLQVPGSAVAPTPFTLPLNDEQAAAIDAIASRLDRFSVNLLFGITGSGKTEVYLRAIEKVVNAGKQAIVLVPEIALTPQTVRRFVERFAGVAVLHSALTNTERHQSWQRISSGAAKVIVGARSAIFAPTKNLGLIVVDEEHESSYKQDTVPRYNARDVAIKRGQIEGVPVVLGSATPSLETWSNITTSSELGVARFGTLSRADGRHGLEYQTVPPSASDVNVTLGATVPITEGATGRGTPRPMPVGPVATGLGVPRPVAPGVVVGDQVERRGLSSTQSAAAVTSSASLSAMVERGKAAAGSEKAMADGEKAMADAQKAGADGEKATAGAEKAMAGEPSATAEAAKAGADSEKATADSPAAGAGAEKAEAEANAGRRFLLRLPARVRGLQLPKVEVLDMRQVNKMRKGVHLISPRLEKLMHDTFAAGEQAILLLNRRGYANCIFCSHCNEAIQCKYCDTTMTYHRAAPLNPMTARTDDSLHTGQMHCHYCLAVNALPATCPQCGKKLALFGLGTQRVEEELKKKFPDLPYARVDSDTMRSKTDYEALLGRFGRGEIKLMLGTQMIAKGLDYPNVTLVGVISGDTALSLPDFRSAERTFQLITQVAGRAGRGDKPGRVVLQTFLPEDMSLQAAVRQDYEGFAEHELAHRKKAQLPPDTRMVRIVLRDESLENLHARGEKLQALLSDAISLGGLNIDLRGPMPCPIERIAGHHRSQMVLTCPEPRPLQRVLAVLRKKEGLVSNEKVAIDVDPVSML